MKKLVSRKELSRIVTEKRGDEITVRQLLDNERRWGLDKARCDLNKRVVRFDLRKALEALAGNNLFPLTLLTLLSILTLSR